ncbi:MAG: histidine-type phosphatase [Selenomonadaceae bacterium]|nr:histidine-type phosphatase [Selenomonadaceae bacterium]
MLKKIFALIALFTLTSFAPANAEDYQLESVVVLSRHNIRSPIADENSVLGKMTPHRWFKWTSAKSELSMRGGELETIMGQYFRKWLTSENLITENYLPEAGEVRFYANSMQRTIATAQFFSSGLFPVANVKIEHKFAPSKMDDVFNPQLTFVNEKFSQIATEQIRATFKRNNFEGNYPLLEKVMDFKKSEYAKSHGLTKLPTGDTEIILEPYKEPAISGSFKLAVMAADALVLQYYEEQNPKQAAFGHKLSFNDWKKIAGFKETFTEALFASPAVAVNVAHPLLQVMREELSLKNRKFTFLCGHDSNIASVLAALNAENFSLPQTPETKTPIGFKLVIEKWRSNDGRQYAALKLIYASSEQLKNKTTLTLENPPVIFPIRLNGLQQNADGLYKLEDLQQRFDDAINAYYELYEENAAA